MVTSESRAKAVSASIAKVREGLTKFTMYDLASALKVANCPYSNNVASLLRKKGVVAKRGKDYVFAVTEPVYYKSIQNELDAIVALYVKKQEFVVDNVVKNETRDAFSLRYGINEQEVIDLLKAKGYKIMKPIINYEEI